MKNLLLLSGMLLLLSACGDDKEELQHAVKFSITGGEVTEAKLNYKNTLKTIKTPFSGTWDTVIYANIGETLSLDAKGSSGTLQGQVFLNSTLVTEQIDPDTDQDGKTTVKVSYTVK